MVRPFVQQSKAERISLIVSVVILRPASQDDNGDDRVSAASQRSLSKGNRTASLSTADAGTFSAVFWEAGMCTASYVSA
jgi:hypothetical protein